DVERMRGFRQRLEEIFAHDLAAGARVSASSGSGAARVVEADIDSYWSPASGTTGHLELELAAPVTFGIVELRESIAHGQHVERYSVHARTGDGWQPVATGT